MSGEERRNRFERPLLNPKANKIRTQAPNRARGAAAGVVDPIVQRGWFQERVEKAYGTEALGNLAAHTAEYLRKNPSVILTSMEDLIQKTLSALNPIPKTVFDDLVRVQTQYLQRLSPTPLWAQHIIEKIETNPALVYVSTPQLFFEKDPKKLQALVREDASLRARVLTFAQGTLWEGFATRVLDECKKGGSIPKERADSIIFANNEDELKRALEDGFHTSTPYQTNLQKAVEEKYAPWSSEGTEPFSESKRYLIDLLTHQAERNPTLFNTLDDFIHATILANLETIKTKLREIHQSKEEFATTITDLFHPQNRGGVDPAAILEFIESPHIVHQRFQPQDPNTEVFITRALQDAAHQGLKELALRDTSDVGLQIQAALLAGKDCEDLLFRQPVAAQYEQKESWDEGAGTTRIENGEQTQAADPGGLAYQHDHSPFLKELERMNKDDRADFFFDRVQHDAPFQQQLRTHLTAPLLTLIDDKLTDLRGRGLDQNHPKIAYFTNLQTQLTAFRDNGTPVNYQEPSDEVKANIPKGFFGKIGSWIRNFCNIKSASRTLIDQLQPAIDALPKGQGLMGGHPPVTTPVGSRQHSQASSLGGATEAKGGNPEQHGPQPE